MSDRVPRDPAEPGPRPSAHGLIDPVQLLAQFRPPRDDRYLPPGENPIADDLLNRISAGDRVDRASSRAGVRRSSTRRVPRAAAIGVAAVLLAGAGGAAAVLLNRHPDDITPIDCYGPGTASTAARLNAVRHSELSPTQQCAAAWSDGRLGGDGPPPLTECVTDTGIIAVIPADSPDVCRQWGWDPADTSPDSVADRADEVVEVVSRRFSERCHGPGEAVATIRAVLHELDLDDWTIADRTTDDLAEASCVYPAIDGLARTVDLVSVAPPGPPAAARPSPPTT